MGFEVWGTRGGASVRNGGAEVALYPLPAVRPQRSDARWSPVDAPVYDRQGRELSGDAVGQRVNQLVVEDLMAACAQGRDPVSNARSATAALEMAMAMFESERVQRRVAIPLATRENPFAVWKSHGRETCKRLGVRVEGRPAAQPRNRTLAPANPERFRRTCRAARVPILTRLSDAN